MATPLPHGLKPLLTQAQLEKYYAVSDWTVRKWIKDGMPTEPTAMRGMRFDIDRVKAWMAARADSHAA